MHFPDESQLGAFPLASGFDVRLRDAGDGNLHAEFVDGGTRLAWFPAWDHVDRDLRHFIPADVPLGTLDEPFEDADEAWRMMLFEHKGFVYVLEADSPRASDFPRFFKVPRDRYIAAWAALIDAYNPITPLDETEN